LPFCYVVLRQERRPAGYPCVLNSLGDHLQKRRLDLGLLWKDVAAQIGTDATNVAYWSKGHTTPGLKFWPRIIQYLGYDPRPKRETVGERLKHHRESRGWSRPELAGKLGVNVSVLWQWESGQRQPKGKYLAKVYAFLNGASR
jgi:transcriptional regulator with XRE-family HTH domain